MKAVPATHPSIAQAIARGLLPAGAVAARRAKFNNRPCECEGERFQSERERDAWLALRERARRGEIADLRRQVRYTLAVNGVWVCDYIADFTHQEGGRLVVTDAKGFRTGEYKLKKRLMKGCHGIDIVEV